MLWKYFYEEVFVRVGMSKRRSPIRAVRRIDMDKMFPDSSIRVSIKLFTIEIALQGQTAFVQK